MNVQELILNIFSEYYYLSNSLTSFHRFYYLCMIYIRTRDDRQAVFKNIMGPQADKIRKDITRHFKTHGLNITIQSNLKIANYLDVTFNLNNGMHYPYRKPNNQPLYINVKSNHPPNIIKQLPDSINRRILDISCKEDEFNKAKTTSNPAVTQQASPITNVSKQPD